MEFEEYAVVGSSPALQTKSKGSIYHHIIVTLCDNTDAKINTNTYFERGKFFK
jgi:hypothetical protein